MKNISVTIISFISLSVIVLLQSCYSLSGISIDPNIETFDAPLFENRAGLVEPTLALSMTEKLKDKIRNSSRLRWTDTNPDLIFNGVITTYTITSVAPVEGATSAFNRLTITLKVNFENTKNEKQNWEKPFTRFVDFESSQDFSDVKDALIEEATTDIMEDVFNESFAKNW
ncbi:MAG: LptE family protein [Saprospiraceae bacterium]